MHAAGALLPTRTVTPDGLEATLAANHVGPFLLSSLLLPALKDNAPSRVVTVASRYGKARLDLDDLGFGRRQYSPAKALLASKLAQVLVTQELAGRTAGTGVVANAFHPGLVGGTQLRQPIGGLRQWLPDRIGRTPAEGADTALWLATDPAMAHVTGGFWADRRRLATPGQGSDAEARRRLWQESLRLAGLAEPAPPRPPELEVAA